MYMYICMSQGEYLGSLLSYTNGEIITQTTQELEERKQKPFKYHHLGSFAYVGDNRAVLQLPIIGTVHVHVHCALRTCMYMCMYICMVLVQWNPLFRIS